MGKKQVAVMEPAIRELFGHEEDENLCLTIQANGNEKLWVQIVSDEVNMSYPFRDDPMARLERLDVKERKLLELVQTEADLFASFGFRKSLTSKKVATMVDRLLVQVLGCDDATYEVEMSVESLNADEDETDEDEDEDEDADSPTIHLSIHPLST